MTGPDSKANGARADASVAAPTTGEASVAAPATDGMGALRYDGATALVVGGASGIGAATATLVNELGGRVIVLDRVAPEQAVGEWIAVDLRDRNSIDAALDRVGTVDAVFGAAGVADGTPGLMNINFIAHRHIVQRLVDDARLRNGAVCLVSSAAGRAWQDHLPLLHDFLATDGFADAERWMDEHDGVATYTFSKQAMNCYVATMSPRLLPHGVRINAICPGPTDTPLARANADAWLGYASDYRQATGTSVLTPRQMAYPMAFLNSPAASGISGMNVFVDHGHTLALATGAWQHAAR